DPPALRQEIIERRPTISEPVVPPSYHLPHTIGYRGALFWPPYSPKRLSDLRCAVRFQSETALPADADDPLKGIRNRMCRPPLCAPPAPMRCSSAYIGYYEENYPSIDTFVNMLIPA